MTVNFNDLKVGNKEVNITLISGDDLVILVNSTDPLLTLYERELLS